MYGRTLSSTFYNPIPLQLARSHLYKLELSREWFMRGGYAQGNAGLMKSLSTGKGKRYSGKEGIRIKKELYGTRLSKTQVVSDVK